MKGIRLKKLEESLEEGIISKEEYETKWKEIEKMPEEKKKGKEEPKTEVKDVKSGSDRILIITLILLVAVFVALFGLKYLTPEHPETIEDLHALNLKGKLKKNQGYLYNGIYSFVKFEDSWYTQFKSPQGSRLYNVQFRYGPKEVEGIKIEGHLDSELFNNATEYYVTFDPTGNDFSHVALAVADFNQHMTNIFFKQPIAACDRNMTFACRTRPIITCDNTDKIVLYVKEANISKTAFDENCIIVEGRDFDLVKNVNRVLYTFYHMMEQ